MMNIKYDKLTKAWFIICSNKENHAFMKYLNVCYKNKNVRNTFLNSIIYFNLHVAWFF